MKLSACAARLNLHFSVNFRQNEREEQMDTIRAEFFPRLGTRVRNACRRAIITTPVGAQLRQPQDARRI